MASFAKRPATHFLVCSGFAFELFDVRTHERAPCRGPLDAAAPYGVREVVRCVVHGGKLEVDCPDAARVLLAGDGSTGSGRRSLKGCGLEVKCEG